MESIEQQLTNAKNAKLAIASLSDQDKKKLIYALADVIKANSAEIIKENLKDLVKLPDTDPKKDRLLLDESRIQGLADSLIDVANLPDPTNQILSTKTLDNGLFVQKKTVPIGIVGVIMPV